MKKILATSAIVLMLAGLGTSTHASEDASPSTSTASSTPITASEDATLSQDTVAVQTSPSEAPTEPAQTPATTAEPATVSEAPASPSEAPTAQEPAQEPVAPSEEPVAPETVEEPTTAGNGQVENNGNPDCQVEGAVQYDDGSCTFPGREVDGHHYDSFSEGEGQTVYVDPTTTAPEAFEAPVEDVPVENNGNPDCQVPGAIQWSDGSCSYTYETQDISYWNGEVEHGPTPDPTLNPEPVEAEYTAPKGQ